MSIKKAAELQPGDVVYEDGVPIGIVQGLLNVVGESISVGPEEPKVDPHSPAAKKTQTEKMNEVLNRMNNYLFEKNETVLSPGVAAEAPSAEEDALTKLAQPRRRKIRKPR